MNEAMKHISNKSCIFVVAWNKLKWSVSLISLTMKYFSSFFFLSLMFWSICQYKKYRFLSINISTKQNPFLSFVDLIWQFEWLHAQPYVLDYVQFLCLEVGVANKRGLQNEKWICKWKFFMRYFMQIRSMSHAVFGTL